MANEIPQVPPAVWEDFINVCSRTSGKARNSRLYIKTQERVGVGEEQATVVRDSAFTTGHDVFIEGRMLDFAITENYHLTGCDPWLVDMLAPVGGNPAAFGMLIMHELGHVTIHPAGNSNTYMDQAFSFPFPRSVTPDIMNILSDLLLNHNVMHGTNIQGTSDEDDIRRMRTIALYGLSALYQIPTCTHHEQHRILRNAGTLPDTRYAPTAPCTVEGCPYQVGDLIHEIGCYDAHAFNENTPDDEAAFKVPGTATPIWEQRVGHGRGNQYYPMISTACKEGLNDKWRTVKLITVGEESPLGSSIEVHNCGDCGNVWYADDTAYTDPLMGAFDEPQSDYAEGAYCPGRIPWAETCGSTNISTFEFAPDNEWIVSETYTWDDRPSSETSIHGMEPIWVASLDTAQSGITVKRGSSGQARIGFSYLKQMCPQCGDPLSYMYHGFLSGGVRSGRGYRQRDLERIQAGTGAEQMFITPISQQLFIHQWAAIYATMTDLFPDLRLRRPTGTKFGKGLPSAQQWLKLTGIDFARDNRGC